MKIKETNKLFQLLVLDPYDNDFFAYDCDIDIPRVVVDKNNLTPTIKTFGDHINVTPRSFESEAEFNRLGIEAILMGYEAFKQTMPSFLSNTDGYAPFKSDVPCLFDVPKEYERGDLGGVSSVLINSDEYTHNIYLASRFCITNSAKLLMFPEIPRGFAVCLPAPEFLGVIAHKLYTNEYGIGIVNTRPIIRVFIGDALSISTQHYKHMEEQLTLCSHCIEKTDRIFGRRYD